ncbi:MAG: hypothetical protein PHO66_02065 [Eubacteriales bacterium]|nr:hypothetical protein [Eubacteriales bacterium]
METANLYLRSFVPGDFSDFAELIRDKMASQYAAYDHPFPTDEGSLKDILSYFCATDEFFAVELKAEKR